MQFTRKKTGPSAYAIHDQTGKLVGHVIKTGSRSDDYPWNWYLADGVTPAPGRRRATGVSETLRDGVDQVADALGAGG